MVEFWLFMVAMDLLIPLVMIFFGRYFQRKAPDKINMLFGYRTARSMKNRDTWVFAHKQAGRYWYRAGWAVLVLSVAAMLFVLGKDIEIVGIWGTAVCFVQCIPLIWVFFVVEGALKRTFDENGNRI